MAKQWRRGGVLGGKMGQQHTVRTMHSHVPLPLRETAALTGILAGIGTRDRCWDMAALRKDCEKSGDLSGLEQHTTWLHYSDEVPYQNYRYTWFVDCLCLSPSGGVWQSRNRLPRDSPFRVSHIWHTSPHSPLFFEQTNKIQSKTLNKSFPLEELVYENLGQNEAKLKTWQESILK